MEHTTEKIDLRSVSIEELVNAYVKLQSVRRHREILVQAMSEVKVSADNWGSETESLSGDIMIMHDVNRLKEIIDWCLEELDKNEMICVDLGRR